MINLRSLYVEHNALVQIPPEIGNLPSLESLILADNQLTHLPAEIGRLAWLQTLVLRENRLTQLPSTIGMLTRLCYLDLDHNQLERLPRELGSVISLEDPLLLCDNWGLHVDDNPLIAPPPDVVAEGTRAMLAYLRKMADENVSLALKEYYQRDSWHNMVAC